MNPLAVDVLVVGAGPAGLATALALRRQGALSVAVVDRAASEHVRVGETLAPGARVLLETLGLWADFQAQEHLPAYGTAAAWGQAELAERDFLMTPFGCGWNLDRQRFDGLLASQLRAAGGQLLYNTRLTSLQRDGDGWNVSLRSETSPSISASFVVDASGRNATLARRLGAELHYLDHQIAVLAEFALPHEATVENSTVVEAFEQGWCYSVKIPGPGLVVALLTDSDLQREHGLGEPAGWWATVQSLPHTRGRLHAGEQRGPLRRVTAHSARLDRFSGEGWLAVGDAACSHDPLSGSGIARALDGGLHAARAIHTLLERGQDGALRYYGDALEAGFERYADSHARYYRMESRWPESVFWQRRRPQVTLDPQQCLRSVPDLQLSARPARLLKVDFSYILHRAVDGCAAHILVAEHRGRRDCPDLAVVLALQWLLEVGALRVMPPSYSGVSS